MIAFDYGLGEQEVCGHRKPKRRKSRHRRFRHHLAAKLIEGFNESAQLTLDQLNFTNNHRSRKKSANRQFVRNVPPIREREMDNFTIATSAFNYSICAIAFIASCVVIIILIIGIFYLLSQRINGNFPEQ